MAGQLAKALSSQHIKMTVGQLVRGCYGDCDRTIMPPPVKAGRRIPS